MPPANSPTETPADTAGTSPYLEQLAQLASPVPDFAATLTTPAEQEANDDNVSFLRESDLQSRRRSVYLYPSEFDYPPANSHADRETQRRMRRAVLQHRRYTPAQLQELDRQNDTPPAVRTALQQPVSYQGWAPGTSDTETDDSQVTNGWRALVREHADREHDDTVRRRLVQMQHDQLTSQLADSSMSWGQSHFAEDSSEGEPTTTDASLRTTALLQSVRRHARFSARSRNQLEHYIQERERVGNQPTGELGGAPLTRQRTVETAERRVRREYEEQEARIRSRVDAMHRARDDITTESPPEASRWLEEAIKYLERLRSCDSYSERISSAAEGGFIRGEYFTHDHEDFILDTKMIPPPPESSWLKVGGVFSGSQRADGASGLPSYQLINRPTRRTSSGHHPRVHIPNITTASRTTPSTATPNLISRAADTGDSWPVKVTINSINYDSMTLSGTMEAFNVPRKSMAPQESSITTFLEGEIIDFNKYTLETKSFEADPSIDSTYWRKLDPFRGLTESEIVGCLISKTWLQEELGKKWILMRWKERCFVTPSDAQSGLTISGFYYVSLRRCDGHLEGLYYDPLSTPYQKLSLMPEKRMFPTYEFR